MNKLSSALFLVVFLSIFAVASGPSVWSVNSRSEVMRGDAHGVSIDDSGNISLAPKLTEVCRSEQPYIWSSVADASVNIYLGSGSDGKIFVVNSSGKGSLFADLAELNVSALAIGRNGELF